MRAAAVPLWAGTLFWAAVLWAAFGAFATAPAQPAPPAIPPPNLPGQPGFPAAACGPGNNSPACRELRRALPNQPAAALPVPRRDAQRPPRNGYPLANGNGNGATGGYVTGEPQSPPVARPDMDDVRGQRFIPPSIRAFLNDRRIDPLTRAYLTGMAGKERKDWTLQDLQTLTAVVPALTELRVSTSKLSEFYEFLGLDPTSLFEPQLGEGWQSTSTAFDQRQFFRRRGRCVNLSRQARIDPASVRLQDLLDCPGENSFGN